MVSIIPPPPPKKRPLWEQARMAAHPTPPVRYTAESPLESSPQIYAPDPMVDEETIRAREALIASGYFPAAADGIRGGLLDNMYAIQIALQLQRDMSVPVDQLDGGNRPRVAQDKIATVWRQPSPSGLQRFWFWCARVYRQFMHFKTRHARLRKRANELEAQIDTLSIQLEHSEQKLLEYTKGTWVEGIQVAFVPGVVTAPQGSWHLQEILHNTKSAEERDIILKLFKEATVSRIVDHQHDAITLSLKLPPAMTKTGMIEHECSGCGRYLGQYDARIKSLGCGTCGHTESRRIIPGLRASNHSLQLQHKIDHAKKRFDRRARSYDIPSKK